MAHKDFQNPPPGTCKYGGLHSQEDLRSQMESADQP